LGGVGEGDEVGEAYNIAVQFYFTIIFLIIEKMDERGGVGWSQGELGLSLRLRVGCLPMRVSQELQ
jgi:hypothetical protein